jgi:hypothetical protein
MVAGLGNSANCGDAGEQLRAAEEQRVAKLYDQKLQMTPDGNDRLSYGDNGDCCSNGGDGDDDHDDGTGE